MGTDQSGVQPANPQAAGDPWVADDVQPAQPAQPTQEVASWEPTDMLARLDRLERQQAIIIELLTEVAQSYGSLHVEYTRLARSMRQLSRRAASLFTVDTSVLGLLYLATLVALNKWSQSIFQWGVKVSLLAVALAVAWLAMDIVFESRRGS